MTVKGYIHIDGIKYRVAIKDHGRQRALTRRNDSYLGTHLVELQAFLDQPEHRWLMDPLLYGVRVFLPKSVIVTQPSIVRRLWNVRI